MRIRIGCITSLLILAAVTSLSVRNNRSLLARSVPVADTHAWWPERIEECPYAWLSNKILFSHSGWWRLENPFTYDIHTQVKTPLAALERRLEKDADMGTNSWALSADRQRILWTMELYDDIRTARLNGSDYQSVQVADCGHGNQIAGVDWLPDGQHWLAETFDHESGKVLGHCLGDVHTPGKVTWLSPEQPDPLITESRICKHTDTHADITLPDAASMLHGTTQHSLKYLAVQPPQGTSIVELEPDPGNHRLLWLLSGERAALFGGRLDRFLPGYARGSHHYMALFISNIDGTGMQEIGRIYLASDLDDQVDAQLSGIAWLPNGKKVSYLYQNTLYTVVVDGS